MKHFTFSLPFTKAIQCRYTTIQAQLSAVYVVQSARHYSASDKVTKDKEELDRIENEELAIMSVHHSQCMGSVFNIQNTQNLKKVQSVKKVNDICYTFPDDWSSDDVMAYLQSMCAGNESEYSLQERH